MTLPAKTTRSPGIPSLDKLAAADPKVRVIHLARNFGHQAAIMAGMDSINGVDAAILMDADLQDDPDEIPRFVQMLDAGYDLVSGWKKERLDPVTKTLPSRLFNAVTARISGVRLHDFNCGFNCGLAANGNVSYDANILRGGLNIRF